MLVKNFFLTYVLHFLNYLLMKNINLLKKLLLVCFISFISLSCGDDDGGSTPTPTPTDPLDSQANLLEW